MKFPTSEYDAALEVFEHSVVAFCRGDAEEADRLLSTLDVHSIECDRVLLRELAKTAQSIQRSGTAGASRMISRETKDAVRLRDRYHCRFTGRRLIDTRVFQEVSRISGVFHFDAHHSVRETRRGPGGHPMVRTHGVAYEHATPLACGGVSSIANIIHTSVQLNESKGAKVLPQVAVPDDGWNGLTEYIPKLRLLKSAPRSNPSLEAISPLLAIQPRRKRVSRQKDPATPAICEAAVGLDVKIFALDENASAEKEFANFRQDNKNAFFVTPRVDGTWMIHRLHCSSLAFNGPQKLTIHPKVCAFQLNDLLNWAGRFGVNTTACKRCPKPK
jgi:hypothetical protein